MPQDSPIKSNPSLDQLSYICGPETEPSLDPTLHWGSSTIPQALKRAVDLWGSRDLLIFTDRRLTVLGLDRESNRMARGLMRLGIRPGDHVATLMANVAEYAVVEIALARIGAATVPINPRYRINELEYSLRQSDSKLLLTAPKVLKSDFLEMLRELCPEIVQAREGVVNSAAFPELHRIVVVGGSAPGLLTYEDVLRLGDNVPEAEFRVQEAQVKPDDTCVLQYTSGTTAFPKLVMLAQGPSLRNAYCFARRAGFDDQDRLLSALPMFHIGGLGSLLGAITVGFQLYMQPSFDAGKSLELIEREKITAYAALELMYVDMRSHADFPRRDISTIKKAFLAGTSEGVRTAAEKMGIKNVVGVYGQSEASSFVAISDWRDDCEKRLNTQGRPLPGVEVRVVDIATGHTLPRGERGEIWVRGWNVMKGYYKNPGETAKVIDHEGWLHTGDAGVITDDGWILFAGRLKDMIRVGGENVSAVEVEQLLWAHPKVFDAVLIGVPHPRLQEVPMAIVQLKEGERASEEEIIEFCRTRISGAKVPRYVEFVKTFETTGSGKIQKFKMRARILAERGGSGPS